MRYDLYMVRKTRVIPYARDLTEETVIDLAKKLGDSAVIYNEHGDELTLEELENAKDFRPEPVSGDDNGISSGDEIFEGSGSELLEIIRDNTE